MAITIKHPFQSAKSDGVDLTLVQPSNWNENHTITMASGKFLGRTSVGTGAVEELAITDFSVPVGTMVPWSGAGDVPPTGWALCNGQALNRTTDAALFAVVSTTYGPGDGATTFNVPDMRGRTVWGRDSMGATAANVLTFSNSNTAGFQFGAETHNHTVTVTGTGSGFTGVGETGDPSGGFVSTTLGGQQSSAYPHTHDIPSLTVTVDSLSASGTTSNALPTGMLPGMIQNWIIKR